MNLAGIILVTLITYKLLLIGIGSFVAAVLILLLMPRPLAARAQTV